MTCISHIYSAFNLFANVICICCRGVSLLILFAVVNKLIESLQDLKWVLFILKSDKMAASCYTNIRANCWKWIFVMADLLLSRRHCKWQLSVRLCHPMSAGEERQRGTSTSGGLSKPSISLLPSIPEPLEMLHQQPQANSTSHYIQKHSTLLTCLLACLIILRIVWYFP